MIGNQFQVNNKHIVKIAYYIPLKVIDEFHMVFFYWVGYAFYDIRSAYRVYFNIRWHNTIMSIFELICNGQSCWVCMIDMPLMYIMKYIGTKINYFEFNWKSIELNSASEQTQMARLERKMNDPIHPSFSDWSIYEIEICVNIADFTLNKLFSLFCHSYSVELSGLLV